MNFIQRENLSMRTSSVSKPRDGIALQGWFAALVTLKGVVPV
jgi:hypothetical protein